MVSPPGVPLSLARLRTRDGVFLDGVIADPPRRRVTALIWVHGLGSVFSSGQPLMRELSSRLAAAGIGYFKFNTRGHDVVARGNARLAGAAFERFGRSVEDIRAVIRAAAARGYRRVVLAGHSTGANKVVHYAARARDRRVASVILLGPVSDVAAEMKRVGAGELRRRIARVERLAARDPDALVPPAWGFWSAQRYLSLFRSGGAEDVFPYYREGARWTAVRKIGVPIAAILGARDEFLDRPAADVIAALERNAIAARAFTGVVISGALHGFQGRERALTDAILDVVSARR